MIHRPATRVIVTAVLLPILLSACVGGSAAPTATVPTPASPPPTTVTATLDPTAFAGTQTAASREEGRVPFPAPASCAAVAMRGPEKRRNFPAFWYDSSGIAVGNATAVFYASDNKVMWQTLDDARPAITGERMDASVPPMAVHNLGLTSGGYISGVEFASPGCWHIHAVAGTETLDAKFYVYPSGCISSNMRDPGARATPMPCVPPGDRANLSDDKTPSAGVTASTARPLVAIRDAGILRFVDPMTGNERWRFGDRDANLGLAVGADGVLFASITAAAGDRTDIVAISLKDFSTERIGAIPAGAYAKRVSGDGAHLSLLRYAGSGDARAPDQLLDFPISDRWRGTRRGPSSTVAEGSVVSSDGRAWYRVDGAMLEIGDQTGASSAIARLPLPASDAFTYSLLIAPDGRTLYVIDYRYGESVYVIDVAQRTVVRTAEIRPRETTKQPPCAANVSPQGDRLYIAARNGRRENGIDVIDTATMQRITTILPDRTFYCLTVSPNGKELYAANGSPAFAEQKDSTLTTIDTQTGREERTVPIAIELVPGLAFATSVSG